MDRKIKDTAQEKMLISKYSPITDTPEEQFLEGILKFIEYTKTAGITSHVILLEAARMIRRLTEFKEIAIGVKDRDGMFRFAAMIGFKEEAEAARKKLAYTLADMKDGSAYQYMRLCKSSQIMLAENGPYKPGEEETFNRPALLEKPRAAPDDMIEGDYIDIFLNDREKEIMAWLELSGTKDGKMPKRETILWMELFAACLTTVLLNAPGSKT